MSIRIKLEEVWGEYVGQCAWCLKREVTKEYEGEEAGGALVIYKVCDKCYADRPNYVREVSK